MSEEWTPAEPAEIIETFAAMLRAATGDGAKKRQAGDKPSWKVDTSHEGAIFSHVCKWKRGELVDPDSGAHPLVHAAWRCLAIAWQETHTRCNLRSRFCDGSGACPGCESLPWHEL